MDLVDDQNLVEQAEQPQRLVFAVQYGQQGLVHRSDTSRCQQDALVVICQPGGAARACRVVLLMHIALARIRRQDRGGETLHQVLEAMSER